MCNTVVSLSKKIPANQLKIFCWINNHKQIFSQISMWSFSQIEEAKEEFNDHSEDVDKINQICKNLQFQLNKMRSFEEPPFENEANIIVDRWLDVCKK